MAWALLPLVFGRRFLNQNQEIIDKIVAAIIVRNNKEALIAHFRAMSDYPSPETFVHSIQYPTLVISGADDPIVSQSDARQLAKNCHGHYKMLPEIGHSIPAEAPVFFQKVVLDFLKQR
jgi:pimeloyl-ACP methyl ester carboxylesterase